MYLNPTDDVIVLAVDKKSQTHALSRNQPVLPMGRANLERVTLNHVRHGKTALFAALDITAEAIFTDCNPRDRHQKFLGFSQADRCGGSKRPGRTLDRRQLRHTQTCKVAGLARHPTSLPHPYIPTYCSWLNQIKRWLGLITQRAIRLGSFRSVRDLVTVSTSSFSTTTATVDPRYGALRQTPSSRNSHDYVHVFLGQDTSNC